VLGAGQAAGGALSLTGVTGRGPSVPSGPGLITSVILRSPLKDGERATMMTPTIRAAIPPASIASSPGVICTRSPKTTIPSAMPASGSPAAMAGSEACSGAALNAFCISQIPTTPAPIRA